MKIQDVKITDRPEEITFSTALVGGVSGGGYTMGGKNHTEIVLSVDDSECLRYNKTVTQHTKTIKTSKRVIKLFWFNGKFDSNIFTGKIRKAI